MHGKALGRAVAVAAVLLGAAACSDWRTHTPAFEVPISDARTQALLGGAPEMAEGLQLEGVMIRKVDVYFEDGPPFSREDTVPFVATVERGLQHAYRAGKPKEMKNTVGTVLQTDDYAKHHRGKLRIRSRSPNGREASTIYTGKRGQPSSSIQTFVGGELMRESTYKWAKVRGGWILKETSSTRYENGQLMARVVMRVRVDRGAPPRAQPPAE